MQGNPIQQPRTTDLDYDLGLFIGRFQIFHEGHAKAVIQALERTDRLLLLGGSANLARDTRNPWTFDERASVIWGALEDHGVDTSRVTIAPLDDSPYDRPAWIASVHHAARGASKALRPRVCLVGNVRDSTSDYLNWFKGWDFIPVPDTQINATAIRRAYFSGGVNFEELGWGDRGFTWREVLTPKTIQFLAKWRDTPTYAYLMEQLARETAYREKWGSGPFQTVDGVVILGDHVLMIERGGPEGEGMLAMPGGFLEAMEHLLDAAAREVIEETGLFIPSGLLPAFAAYLAKCKAAMIAREKAPPMPNYMLEAIAKLKSFVRGRGERFGDPHRSRRGHLITEAFLFALPDNMPLPYVTGMDDARRAFWMPQSEVRPDNSMEDHAFIIDRMISLYA